MLILVWVIAAILLFNVLFVAVRVWATRPRRVSVPRSHGLAPAYATIIAKEYPRHVGRRGHVRRHSAHH